MKFKGLHPLRVEGLVSGEYRLYIAYPQPLSSSGICTESTGRSTFYFYVGLSSCANARSCSAVISLRLLISCG